PIDLRNDAGFLVWQNEIDEVIRYLESWLQPEDSSHFVDLDQMAAVVNRSKSTLEKMKRRKNNPLPLPDIEGGGGKKDEWLWTRIRPWVELEFKKQFSQTCPRRLT